MYIHINIDVYVHVCTLCTLYVRVYTLTHTWQWGSRSADLYVTHTYRDTCTYTQYTHRLTDISMRNLWSLVHHRSIHIHKQDKNTHTRYKHTHTHTHTHTHGVCLSLPCCCASPAHAAGTTHAHSHAHKHTMSTCRTMRSTAAAALYLKLRQRGKPHGWKHTRMNTGTRWHGHYLATASALLPPACAAGVRREKNVAHKMHCSRGHQERHRAMAARCGGGRARYIPKRATGTA